MSIGRAALTRLVMSHIKRAFWLQRVLLITDGLDRFLPFGTSVPFTDHLYSLLGATQCKNDLSESEFGRSLNALGVSFIGSTPEIDHVLGGLAIEDDAVCDHRPV